MHPHHKYLNTLKKVLDIISDQTQILEVQIENKQRYILENRIECRILENNIICMCNVYDYMNFSRQQDTIQKIKIDIEIASTVHLYRYVVHQIKQ